MPESALLSDDAPPINYLTRWVRRPPRTTAQLLVIYGLLLLVCLTLGAALYRGQLSGQADDLNNLNRVKFTGTWQFLSWKFFNWGPIGNSLMMTPWRVLGDFGDFTPDTFPWWLPTAASSFLLLATLVNLALGTAAVLPAASRAFLIAFMASLWLVHPEVYSITLTTPVTFFGGYALPLFLSSLVPLLITRRFLWLPAYILPSLATSVFGMAFPVLALSSIAVLAVLEGRLSRRLITKAALVAAATVASFAVMMLAPGFKIRMASVGAVSKSPAQILNSLPVWFEDTVNRAYGMLFGHHFSDAWRAHTIVLCGLVLAVVALAVSMHRAMAPRETSRRRVALAVMALGFLAAFHASVASLLFSPYFPDYSMVFPMYLLVAGLGLSLVLASSLAWPVAVQESGPILSGVALIALILWNVSAANIQASVQVYQFETWLGRVRQNVEQSVLRAHEKNAEATLFHLSGCPVSLESWGASATPFEGYFSWMGQSDLRVVNHGAGPPQPAPSAPATTIACVVPPLFPWRWSGDETFFPQTVRRTITADVVEGREAWDFWVDASVYSCIITGSYNPSVGGSPLYREVFRSRLALPVVYGANAVVRRIDSATVFGDDSPVQIGWLTDRGLQSDVPIAAFDRPREQQPLLQVVIRKKPAAWLAAYSSVTLTCP